MQLAPLLHNSVTIYTCIHSHLQLKIVWIFECVSVLCSTVLDAWDHVVG